jgi:hypothetical protein
MIKLYVYRGMLVVCRLNECFRASDKIGINSVHFFYNDVMYLVGKCEREDEIRANKQIQGQYRHYTSHKTKF